MAQKPAGPHHGLGLVDGAYVWNTLRGALPITRPLDALSGLHLQNLHRFAVQHHHPADHVAVLRTALAARGLDPLSTGESHAR